jgi:NADH dehydrogenase
MKEVKEVVVVGAGFGGLQAVKKLAKYNELKITLIDRANHHLFQPLLYQVATAVLSPQILQSLHAH